MGMSTYIGFIYGVPESEEMAAQRVSVKAVKQLGCSTHGSHSKAFCEKCGTKSQPFNLVEKVTQHPHDFYGDWVHDSWDGNDLHVGLAVGRDAEAGQDCGFFPMPTLSSQIRDAVQKKLKELGAKQAPQMLLRISVA